MKRFVITNFWVCIKVWSAISGLHGVFWEVRGRNLEWKAKESAEYCRVWTRKWREQLNKVGALELETATPRP